MYIKRRQKKTAVKFPLVTTNFIPIIVNLVQFFPSRVLPTSPLSITPKNIKKDIVKFYIYKRTIYFNAISIMKSYSTVFKNRMKFTFAITIVETRIHIHSICKHADEIIYDVPNYYNVF